MNYIFSAATNTDLNTWVLSFYKTSPLPQMYSPSTCPHLLLSTQLNRVDSSLLTKMHHFGNTEPSRPKLTWRNIFVFLFLQWNVMLLQLALKIFQGYIFSEICAQEYIF